MSAGGQGPRTAAVLFPLVLLLVAVGAYGAHLAFGEPRSTAAASRASGTDSTSGSGPDAASTSLAACWDGSSAGSAADCRPLAGSAGLAWVFPSFDPADPDCRDRTQDLASPGSLLRWECAAEVGGAEIYLTYRQFANVGRGVRLFDDEYGSGERSDQSGDQGQVLGVVWDLSIDEHHSRTVMYADAPFSVTLWAVDEAQADQALADIVRMRGPARVAAQPVSRAG